MRSIKLICPKCGNDTTIITSKKESFNGKEYGECSKCYYTTYREGDSVNTIQCPYCNSPNVNKISTASKVAGIATFGVFAINKATKEWHCNNCKSNF